MNFSRLREAQLKTLAVPNTAMLVTNDISDGDVHRKDKQDVGYRLALAAQSVAYRQDVIYSGPICDSMAVQGQSIRSSMPMVD